MGSRLGSTKHVLVSVVVQMTGNLVISLACCPEFTIITWFRPFNGELLGRPILRVCFFVPFWGQKGDPLFWPCFQFLEPKPPRLASRLASIVWRLVLSHLFHFGDWDLCFFPVSWELFMLSLVNTGSMLAVCDSFLDGVQFGHWLLISPFLAFSVLLALLLRFCFSAG